MRGAIRVAGALALGLCAGHSTADGEVPETGLLEFLGEWNGDELVLEPAYPGTFDAEPPAASGAAATPAPPGAGDDSPRRVEGRRDE